MSPNIHSTQPFPHVGDKWPGGTRAKVKLTLGERVKSLHLIPFTTPLLSYWFFPATIALFFFFRECKTLSLGYTVKAREWSVCTGQYFSLYTLSKSSSLHLCAASSDKFRWKREIAKNISMKKVLCRWVQQQQPTPTNIQSTTLEAFRVNQDQEPQSRRSQGSKLLRKRFTV